MSHTINKLSGGEVSFLEKDKTGVYRKVDRKLGLAFGDVVGPSNEILHNHAIINEWSPKAQNWTIELDFLLDDDTVNEQTILEGEAFRIFVDGFVEQGQPTEIGNPILELKQNGTAITRNLVPATKERAANEKWLSVTISYDGSNLTLKHNNIQTSIENIQFDPFNLSIMGMRLDGSGGMYGKVRSLVLEDHLYPLNSRHYVPVKQSGGYIEDIKNPGVNVSVPSEWGTAPLGITVDAVNNKITMDGTQANGAILDTGLVANENKHYIIKYTIEAGSKGQFQVRTSDVRNNFNSTPGDYEYIENLYDWNIGFQSGSGADKFKGTISNIQIIETDAIRLEYHNEKNWFQKRSESVDNLITYIKHPSQKNPVHYLSEKNSIEAAAYDLSDISSLYGSHEAREVTGFGQEVGLIVDKSKGALTENPVSAKYPGLNVVAACYYDTTEDSDGGAWVESVTGKSWQSEAVPSGKYLGQHNIFTDAIAAGGVDGDWYYNPSNGKFWEIISGGTTNKEIYRAGSSKFPKRVFIVAENGRVIIFDATTDALEMWMVFNASAYNMAIELQVNAVTALNGRLYIGCGGTGYDFYEVIFPSDEANQYSNHTSISGFYSGTISQRNDGLGHTHDGSVPNIVDRKVNDVAVTVLPNAPTDANGLKVPTVAVATNGGVSVIDDGGSVVNSIDTYGCSSLRFEGSELHYTMPSTGSFLRIIEAEGLLNGFVADRMYGYDSGNPPLTGSRSWSTVDMLCPAGTSLALRQQNSKNLTILEEDTVTKIKGMSAYVSDKHNTGWMVGDTKLAALCDTETGSISGAELVANGDFETTEGWTPIAGATLGVLNGELEVTSTGTNYCGAEQTLSTVVGKTYNVEATLRKGTCQGTVEVLIGDLSIQNSTITNISDTGTFTATSTTTTIYLRIGGIAANGETAYFDNISVKELSAEKVTNSTFETLEGWGVWEDSGGTGATISTVDGKLKLQNNAGNTKWNGAYYTFPTVAGKTYKVTCYLEAPATNGTSIYFRGSSGAVNVHNTTFFNIGCAAGSATTGEATFTADGTSFNVHVMTANEDIAYLDNVVVTEVDADLVTNRTFETTESWNANQATLATVSGELEATSTATNWAQATQQVPTTVGKFYLISGSVRKGTGTGASLAVYTGAGQTYLFEDKDGITKTENHVVEAFGSTFDVKCHTSVTAVGQTGYFDNISVNELGSNIVSNGTFDADISGWVQDSGSVTWDSTNAALKVTDVGGTDGVARLPVPTVAGKKYLLRFTCISANGQALVRMGDNTSAGHGNDLNDTFATSVSTPTEFSYIVTSGFNNGGIGFGSASLDASVVVDNVTLEEIIEVGDGVEKVTNGTFDTDLSGWSTNSTHWQVVTGRAYHAANSAYHELKQSFANLYGGKYLVKCQVEVVSGAAQLFYNTNPTTTVVVKKFTTVGVHEVEFFIDSGILDIGFSRTDATAAEFYVDNVSVQKVDTSGLVTNGTFETKDNWSLITNTTNGGTPTFEVVNGKATINLGGNYDTGIHQSGMSFVSGKKYRLKFDIGFNTNFNGGNILAVFAGGVTIVDNTIHKTGTYVYDFVAATNGGSLLIRSAGGGNTTGEFTLDNISIEQMFVENDDFETLSGWTIEDRTNNEMKLVDGAVEITGTNDYSGIYQDFPVVAGSTYRVEWEVMRPTANNFQLTAAIIGATVLKWDDGTDSGASIVDAGIVGAFKKFVRYITPSTSGTLRLRPNQSSTVTEAVYYDNISVKEVLPTELVTNGTFETTENWSALNSSTIAAVDGKLRVTPLSGNTYGAARHTISTVAGRTYRLAVYISSSSNTSVQVSGNSNLISPAVHDGIYEAHFTAIGTSTNVELVVNNSTGTYADFDNVSVVEVTPDRSGNSNHLNVIGTLTREVFGTGELAAWNGFGVSNYPSLEAGKFDLSTGGYACIWMKHDTDYNSLAGNRAIFGDWDSGNITGPSKTGFRVYYNSNEDKVLATFMNSTNGDVGLPGEPYVADGKYHKYELIVSGTTIEFYVDNVLKGQNISATFATPLSDFLVGVVKWNSNITDISSNPLGLFRLSKTIPSADQRSKMYKDELAMLQGKAVLDGGSSDVKALAYDSDTNVLHVATTWGRNEFIGLERIKSVASSVGTLASLSAADGSIIEGGSTGVNAKVTKDVLDQPGNHINQSHADKLPILGRKPARGRVNLLDHSEDFSNAVWTLLNGPTLTSGQTSPTGDNSAYTISLPENALIRQDYSGVLGESNTFSIHVEGVAGETLRIVMESRGGTYEGNVYNITLSGEWDRVHVSHDWQYDNHTGIRVYLQRLSSHTASSVKIWGAQLEEGELSNYQRVTNDHDVFEIGQKHVHYLEHDGDDALTVSLPTGMSANSTVGYARPGIGAEFTRGVDLSTGTYTLDTAEHYACVLLGYDLTAKEKARVREWLNERADKVERAEVLLDLTKQYYLKTADKKAFADLVTFTRASTALDENFVEKAVNTPRLESNGLLVEQESTNLFTNSDPNNGAIYAQATKTQTDGIFGTGTAIVLEATSSTAWGGLYIGKSPKYLTTLTLSAVVKAGTVDVVSFWYRTGNNPARFNIGPSPYVISFDSRQWLSAKVEPLENGKVLISATTNMVYDGVDKAFYIIVGDGTSYVGNIIIDHYQLEESDVETSLIRTTTAAVTRSKDIAKVTDVSEMTKNKKGTYHMVIDGADSLNGVLAFNGTAAVLTNVSGSGTVTVVQTSINTGKVYVDGVIAYEFNQYHGIDFSTMTEILLADTETGKGHIKTFRYYDYAMTDDEVTRLEGNV